MRKALIDETGTVVNVIEIAADSNWSAPEGHKLVASATASTGDAYSGGKFVTPVAPNVPVKVTSDAAFTKGEQREIRERLGL